MCTLSSPLTLGIPMIKCYSLIKRHKHDKAGEEALGLSALAAHAEDLGWVPSTHTGPQSIAYDSSPRRPNVCGLQGWLYSHFKNKRISKNLIMVRNWGGGSVDSAGLE